MALGILDYADDPFRLRYQLVVGGSGFFLGTMDRIKQSPSGPADFTAGRRMLRVDKNCSVQSGAVISDPDGVLFMVGSNGASDQVGGSYRSFRLVEATHQLSWKKRIQVVDPVTHLEKEAPSLDMGLIWCAYEPDAQEAFDRQIHSNFETARLITASSVGRDDLIGVKKIARVDLMIGLRICHLS